MLRIFGLNANCTIDDNSRILIQIETVKMTAIAIFKPRSALKYISLSRAKLRRFRFLRNYFRWIMKFLVLTHLHCLQNFATILQFNDVSIISD